MQQPLVFFLPAAAPTTIATIQEPRSASDTPAGGAPSGTTAAPGAPQPQPQSAPGLFDGGFLWMMLAFVVLMLFFSMRRDSKARKEQQAMLAAIKQGDRVVTTSGMHAAVHRVDEKTVTLLFDTVPVTFERAAIARIVRDDASRTEQKRA
ncbi:MAG: preprotein translocase subunit YajC [Planctomycetes bacterium]|nr:preprotein translocase subunit YajC [Planctomycetota bacterium]